MRAAALLLCLTLALSARANPAPAPDPFAPIKAQIDALLEHRRQPPPFTPAKENPFQQPGTTASEAQPFTGPTPSGTPAAAPPGDLIHRIAARLKISGTVNLGGRQQVIINSVACEEGKIVPIREGDMLYRVHIKRIAPTTLTIEVDGAELSLPLR